MAIHSKTSLGRISEKKKVIGEKRKHRKVKRLSQICAAGQCDTKNQITDLPIHFKVHAVINISLKDFSTVNWKRSSCE